MRIGFVRVFVTDDIQQTYKELSAKGVEFKSGPEKQAWDGTLAQMKDLDGNVLTLMESAD